MTDIYLHFRCTHYGLYGNAPVPSAYVLSSPAMILRPRFSETTGTPYLFRAVSARPHHCTDGVVDRDRYTSFVFIGLEFFIGVLATVKFAGAL